MSKQDRQGVRTANDLEQKYNFGKSFAEVMGIATDAQKAADEANESFKNLDAQEVYNRLTDNGKSQGLFRNENGDLYVNAKYLYALDELFANDINMSGTFTHKVNVFIEPSQEELETIKKHVAGAEAIIPSRIALYDFNNDGVVDVVDLAAVSMSMQGKKTIASRGWSGAVNSDVTLTIDLKNPNKFIRVTGENMWGRTFDEYIGVNGTSFKNLQQADYVVEEGTYGLWTYRKWCSGACECWGIIEGLKAGTTDDAAFNRLYDLPFPILEQHLQITNYGTWGIKEIRIIRQSDPYSFAFTLYAENDAAATTQAAVSITIKGYWQ